MTINNSIFVHRTTTIKLVKTPSETDDHEYASIDITITESSCGAFTRPDTPRGRGTLQPREVSLTAET